MRSRADCGRRAHLPRSGASCICVARIRLVCQAIRKIATRSVQGHQFRDEQTAGERFSDRHRELSRHEVGNQLSRDIDRRIADRRDADRRSSDQR